LEKRWVSVAFTWNGLRALGADEASLVTGNDQRMGERAAARAHSAHPRRSRNAQAWTQHDQNSVGAAKLSELHTWEIFQ
jgi:hypothetical protein